jgi:hypothetical protein
VFRVSMMGDVVHERSVSQPQTRRRKRSFRITNVLPNRARNSRPPRVFHTSKPSVWVSYLGVSE